VWGDGESHGVSHEKLELEASEQRVLQTVGQERKDDRSNDGSNKATETQRMAAGLAILSSLCPQS